MALSSSLDDDSQGAQFLAPRFPKPGPSLKGGHVMLSNFSGGREDAVLLELLYLGVA